MNSKRIMRRAFRPARPFTEIGGAAAALMVAAAPFALSAANAAAPRGAPAPAAAPHMAGQGIADFYRARSGRQLWLAPQSGEQVRAKGARKPGKGKLPAIEDAPGRYVQER